MIKGRQEKHRVQSIKEKEKKNVKNGMLKMDSFILPSTENFERFYTVEQRNIKPEKLLCSFKVAKLLKNRKRECVKKRIV